MIPASLAPKNGDASTETESTIAKIPTPIRNARDMPEASEKSGKEIFFTADKILIATGSRPFRPDHIPFDDPDIFDSGELPRLSRIPKNVLVIGGGSIGCEFASIFTAFGIPVTIVQSGQSLVRSMDGEVSHILREEDQVMLLTRSAKL